MAVEACLSPNMNMMPMSGSGCGFVLKRDLVVRDGGGVNSYEYAVA